MRDKLPQLPQHKFMTKSDYNQLPLLHNPATLVLTKSSKEWKMEMLQLC